MPKIEKGIPLPPSMKRSEVSRLLRAMSPGDSILLELKWRSSIYAKAHYYGLEIAVRKEGDKIRVWKR